MDLKFEILRSGDFEPGRPASTRRYSKLGSRRFDSTLLVSMFSKAHPVFLVTQRMLRVVMGYAERQVPAGNYALNSREGGKDRTKKGFFFLVNY